MHRIDVFVKLEYKDGSSSSFVSFHKKELVEIPELPIMETQLSGKKLGEPVVLMIGRQCLALQFSHKGPLKEGSQYRKYFFKYLSDNFVVVEDIRRQFESDPFWEKTNEFF